MLPVLVMEGLKKTVRVLLGRYGLWGSALLAATPLSVSLSHVSGAAAPARAEYLEALVATVNGEPLWLSQVRKRMQPFAEALASEERRAQKAQWRKLFDQVTTDMVDVILVRQAAGAAKVTVTPTEIDRAIENIRGQSGLDREEFLDLVKQQGFDETAYRADVRDQILRLKLLNLKVRSRVEVDEGEVRSRYARFKAQGERALRLRVSHIFFPADEAATASEVEAARLEAANALDVVFKEGFDTALERYQGGDLGWLRQEDLPAPLENALLSLSVGGVSQPVRDHHGWHILKLTGTERANEELPSYEEKAEEIRQELLEEAMKTQEQSYLAQLRRSALVVRAFSVEKKTR